MARGGYTFDQIKQMSNIELWFLHHYQELVKKEQQEFIVDSLGIVWDKSSFKDKLDTGKKQIEKLFIPLSVAINPDLLTYVKKQFNIADSSQKSKGPAYIGGGEYMPKTNEVVNSLGDLSKDDFMQMIGKKSRK